MPNRYKGNEATVINQLCSFLIFISNTVMRPLSLVESRSQDVAANAGMLSVYFASILYDHLSCSLKLKERIYPVSIHCASLLELPITINLY